MQSIDLDEISRTVAELIPQILLCGVIVLVIVCTFFKNASRVAFIISLAGLAIHLVSLILLDDLAGIKSLLTASTLLTIALLHSEKRSETFLFIICALLGAELLVWSDQFILVLLSMELISISSYILTAGTISDRHRAEAAWKFFIYGSIATAVMIFGMTYLFGSTGELTYPTKPGGDLTFIIGIVMILGGFLFKMTAAPFHLWAPDVYESTPAPIIAFLSVVPKVAAFFVIFRMTAAYGGMTDYIAPIAGLTIVAGTLAALGQSNAKRMMAYSSVAQAGFLLLILASMETTEEPGWEALGKFLGTYDLSFFYLVVFAIMNFAVFIVIHHNEQAGRGTDFKDFAGMGYANPLLGVAITLGLVSLVGLPPMAGFMAKLFVFKAIWTKYTASHDLILLSLFIVGLLATVASLYFYLKIPFYAFLRRPPSQSSGGQGSEEKEALKIPLFTNLLLIILVGLLLALFVAPGLLMG